MEKASQLDRFYKEYFIQPYNRFLSEVKRDSITHHYLVNNSHEKKPPQETKILMNLIVYLLRYVMHP